MTTEQKATCDASIATIKPDIDSAEASYFESNGKYQQFNLADNILGHTGLPFNIAVDEHVTPGNVFGYSIKCLFQDGDDIYLKRINGDDTQEWALL